MNAPGVRSEIVTLAPIGPGAQQDFVPIPSEADPIEILAQPMPDPWAGDPYIDATEAGAVGLFEVRWNRPAHKVDSVTLFLAVTRQKDLPVQTVIPLLRVNGVNIEGTEFTPPRFNPFINEGPLAIQEILLSGPFYPQSQSWLEIGFKKGAQTGIVDAWHLRAQAVNQIQIGVGRHHRIP